MSPICEVSRKNSGVVHSMEPFVPIDCMMNFQMYIKITGKNAAPTLANVCPNKNTRFKQDLSHCDKFKIFIATFQRHKTYIIDWSENSLELNPLKNLWSVVKKLKCKY